MAWVSSRSTSADRGPGVVRFTTSRGVRVVVVQQAGPGVGIAAAVQTLGAETRAAAGVGGIVAGALFGSNSNLSREGVARAVYFAGGGFRTTWTPECLAITCVSTPEAFSRAVWILAQGLKNAEMDVESASRAVRALLAEQQREAHDSVTVGAQAVRARLYQGHPYGRAVLGTPDNMRRIPRDSLLNYYRQAFSPANTVVAVCGNLDVAYIRRVMENNFVDYERAGSMSSKEPLVPSAPELTGPSDVRVAATGSTAAVVVGYRTGGIADAAYPATRVLAALIGSGKGARLFQAVRERRGIGYRVGAELHAFSQGGVLYVYAEVDAARAAPAFMEQLKSLVVGAAEGVLTQPPSVAEVERARRLAAGLQRQSRQRSVDLAAGLARAELLAGSWDADWGLADRLERVEADDVMGVARGVLENRCVAVVGPAGLTETR